jgi:hypothetical protein
MSEGNAAIETLEYVAEGIGICIIFMVVAPIFFLMSAPSNTSVIKNNVRDLFSPVATVAFDGQFTAGSDPNRFVSRLSCVPVVSAQRSLHHLSDSGNTLGTKCKEVVHLSKMDSIECSIARVMAPMPHWIMLRVWTQKSTSHFCCHCLIFAE